MEGQVAKRRRVYSPEPNKVAQSLFTRNYVNHLVPALKKIKGCSHCDDNLKSVVKYEVDMAMVFSAQGFAWSKGLKAKLQRDNNIHDMNAATTTTRSNIGEGSSSIRVYNNNKGNGNPNSKSKEMQEEDDEDMMIERQLRSLRGLMPGGEEMVCGDEQMVDELESYISCLQMQVKVLQCLLPPDEMH